MSKLFLSVPYREYPILKQGSGGKLGSNKPLIDLEIKNTTRSIPALLDSGADRSISFKDIGEKWFGLEFTNQDKFLQGISGLHTCNKNDCEDHPNKATAYLKPVNFILKEKEINLNIIWLDRPFNAPDDVLLILGRDFFNNFDILFKQREEEIKLFE
jgi:hypothetical protein